MTRARWLSVHTSQPNALPRDEHRRRELLGVVRDAIIAIGVVIAALLLMPMIIEAAAHDIRMDPGYPTAPIDKPCAPPTEHEQLHVVVTWRGPELVTSCLYVGPRGAYRRTPTGAPEVRP